ncbi:MAG TPA: hypothetical protein DDW54_02100 [Clostridiales bacterium]|nr:hypothetical protein [Clostridiales bacterium]
MYEDYTDNQLIALHKRGNTEVFASICERYRRMIKSVSRRFFIFGGDEEDLLQEGFLGLLTAVETYCEDKNSAFGPFARLCAESRVKTAVSKAGNKGNAPLNNALPLDFAELLFDPERTVIDRENRREKAAELRAGLSETENGVLDCYFEGFSYGEIADKMQISEKSVDNAIQRAKSKMKDNYAKSRAKRQGG